MSELLTELGVLNVHVVNQPVRDPEPKYIKRMTTRTITLTATNQFLELVGGPDPNREEITIIAIDVPVVLSDSMSQAQASDNTTVGIANPRGAIIPVNVAFRICGQSGLWISAPLTGANIARVGVITVHRALA